MCAWLLISAACLLGVRQYFEWQSGGNEAIAAYGRDYLSICMLFSLTLLRQAVLPVVIAGLLSLTGWLPSVWISFAAAELVCIPLALRLWRKNWNTLRKTMGYAV